MGAKKTTIYDHVTQRNSQLAFAISIGARIEILKFLDQGNIASGSDFLQIIDLHKGTIQEHLKVLERAGLIVGEYYGKRYMWRMNLELEDDLKKIRWSWKNSCQIAI